MSGCFRSLDSRGVVQGLRRSWPLQPLYFVSIWRDGVPGGVLRHPTGEERGTANETPRPLRIPCVPTVCGFGNLWGTRETPKALAPQRFAGFFMSEGHKKARPAIDKAGGFLL